MAWARISDDFHDHAKVAELTVDLEGLAALGLWTLALSWVRADRRRGGVIPTGIAMRLSAGNGKQLASRLVDASLWDETPGGWRFHDFDHIYTPEDLAAKRAEAGRKGGLQSGRTRRERSDGSNTEASAKQLASSDEAKGLEASHTRAGATTHYPEASKEASVGGTGSYSSQGRTARDENPPPSDEPPSVVEKIMTEYRDNSPRGVSRTVAAKLAGHVHELLADGFHENHIREGLGQLRVRKLGPGALPSLVDEIANAPAASNVAPMNGRANGRASLPPSNAPAVIPPEERCPDHRGEIKGKCRHCRALAIGRPQEIS